MTKHNTFPSSRFTRKATGITLPSAVAKLGEGCQYCNCIATAQEMVVTGVVEVVAMVVDGDDGGDDGGDDDGGGGDGGCGGAFYDDGGGGVGCGGAGCCGDGGVGNGGGDGVSCDGGGAICVIPRGISDTTRLFICEEFKFMYKYCFGFYVKIQTISQSSTLFYRW